MLHSRHSTAGERFSCNNLPVRLRFFNIFIKTENHFVKSVSRFYLYILNISDEWVIQSILSKSDTFGAGTRCPSKRDVRLIESQIKGVKKGRDQL